MAFALHSESREVMKAKVQHSWGEDSMSVRENMSGGMTARQRMVAFLFDATAALGLLVLGFPLAPATMGATLLGWILIVAAIARSMLGHFEIVGSCAQELCHKEKTRG
jgi:hypothetical protein